MIVGSNNILIFCNLSVQIFSWQERPSAADNSHGNPVASPHARLSECAEVWLQQVHCGFDSTERQVVFVVVPCKEHQTSRVTTASGRRAALKSVDGKVLCFWQGGEDWLLGSQRGRLLLQTLRRICTLVMAKIYIWSLVLSKFWL